MDSSAVHPVPWGMDGNLPLPNRCTGLCFALRVTLYASTQTSEHTVGPSPASDPCFWGPLLSGGRRCWSVASRVGCFCLGFSQGRGGRGGWRPGTVPGMEELIDQSEGPVQANGWEVRGVVSGWLGRCVSRWCLQDGKMLRWMEDGVNGPGGKEAGRVGGG